MKSGSVGRADLLDAYRAGGPELQLMVARLLGLEIVVPKPIIRTPENAPAPGATLSEPSPPPVAVYPITFWQAATYTRIEPSRDGDEHERVEIMPDDELDANRTPPPPLAFRPLASAAAVLTKLRGVSSFTRTRGELDAARLVDHLGRGRFPRSLPRLTRKAWGKSVHVILDNHEHLKPYRFDQQAALEALRRVYPRDGVDVVELRHRATRPHRPGTPRSATYQPPEPDTTILALSDLGVLARGKDQPSETWLALGKLYRERRARPIALVPCELTCVPPELKRDWIVIPWEGHIASRTAGLSPLEAEQTCRRILTLLSYALRIEPLLIREVRRLLVKGGLGAGLEARVWQDPALRGQVYEAAEFYPDEARRIQVSFDQETREIRAEVIALIRRCHVHDHEFVWFMELLGLEAETATLGFADSDLGAAVRWTRRQGADAAKLDPISDKSLWFRRAFMRIPAVPLNGSAGDALHRIWALTSAPKDLPPTGLDPARVPSLGRLVRTWDLVQVGGRLCARLHRDGPEESPGHGSKLALIRSRNAPIKIEPFDDFWESGVPPAWADSWGTDDFGPWVDLRVEGAKQRLRWIPPGSFWMGSPEDEEGRYPDEGPRHEETIASGFWMFDMPCTQILWEAVMAEDPSHFKGPDRPVENVSWDQCQEFVRRLNARCEGLELRLPAEAQWEYACRAGTDTPRYRQDLNEIAWYGDNSNEESHPVGQKVPNDWGLYDTLGNVFEWCEDVWTDDYNANREGAASAHRVIRGGSWDYDARLVRAAFRLNSEPSDRYDYLGFRCAEFRAPGPVGRIGKQEAERARERGAGRAEHPADRDQASVAGWINLDAPGMDSVPFAALAPLRVSSDVEQVVLRTTTRPEWASAIGRDRFGLWAELTIERKVAKWGAKRGARKKKKIAPPEAPPGPVRQRFRWIPPGRFLMGSPQDEEGRYPDEGPQHEVMIGDGFWMFDTPCTQALWEALMGENPSEFKSPGRPVENVSWDDCRKFVEKINEKFNPENAGPSLSLPSEAQWEYACRAGTTTATYAGPMEIEGANNAPILHEIAWYGGNSGVDFELSNGYDASKWSEKQFNFDKAGTHPVARKKANPWGLYDMLGNVWEWCEDVWVKDFLEKLATAAADSTSAHRVIRGGSWYGGARSVRAACRDRLEPSDRVYNLGFRCAEFREGLVGGARLGSEAKGAEPPVDRDPTSVAARLDEGGGLTAQPN
jgi:formylglycine-generating enzyme required for sulfatase activity